MKYFSFSILSNFKQIQIFINILEKCSTILFGPMGKFGIFLNRSNKILLLTNGSIIFKNLKFNSSLLNNLLKIIEDGSLNTLKNSGDGSLSTTLLTLNLLKNSFSYLKNGYNPILLSYGLKKTSLFCNEKIFQLSKSITQSETLKGIFYTSSIKKISESLQYLLLNALEIVNRNSLLLVEENPLDDYCLEKLQGIEVNKGFASSYFVNNFLNFEVVLENPYLLITSYPINSISQLEKVLEFIKKGNKPLVIIAEQVSKEVLSSLILMNIQKKFNLGVICFKSIQFLKNFILEDLAFLTHSEYFPKTSKIETEKKIFFPRELGQAEKVIIKKEKSTFFISKFSKLTTFRRINELNRELLVAETDHEKELIKLRRARLTGNISKIKIPNTVISQITNEKQNLENLFCLIQSSLEEGIVPGGGTFFFLLKNEVFNWSYLNLIGDEIFSIQIFLKSILICFKTLCINSNFSIWEILKNLEIQGYPFAYDFKRKKIVNSLTDGLIDSSKCTRYILWNSIINTSNLLTLF